MQNRSLVTGIILVSLAAILSAAGPQKTAGVSGGKQEPLSVDVNKPDPDGTTPLHKAVRAGDVARVRALIKAGADVKAVTRYGATPIALAATNGSIDIMTALLEAGADPNSRSFEGEPVLMTAARTGEPTVVKKLIAAGADVNAKESWYQQTALMWAAARNHPEAVKILVAAGADLNVRSGVSERAGDAGGCGLCGSIPGAFTAATYAAREGAIEVLRVLADAGADLNIGDPNGVTPLVYALVNGHYDAATLLIEKGADPNAVDRTGRGPLFAATDMHSLEWRQNRPDPRFTDKHTPLDLMSMLLEHGADVNQALTAKIIPVKGYAVGNRNLTAGSTSFLKAATTSDVEAMRLLLEWGADPFAVNAENTNAVMMACGLNWFVLASRGTEDEAIEAVKFLTGLGLDINSANANGETALHGAASRTDDQDANKLIQFLVDHGANLWAKTKKGRLPFDEAHGEEFKASSSTLRAANRRSAALLESLMKTHPEPAKGLASAQ